MGSEVVPDPGMKLEKNTMTTDETAIVCRHTEAVTKMLIGNRIMKPGAAILVGEHGGIEGRMRLAAYADAVGIDLVFLNFADTAEGYRLDISVVAPRGGICHGQTDCQLYLSMGGDCTTAKRSRAVPPVAVGIDPR